MREKTLRDGKEMLCEELDKIIDKGALSVGDLEILHKISDTLKNLMKIELLEDETGYSERRHRDSRGRYSREPYDENGNSYAVERRRGMYSHEDGKERMMRKFSEIMDGAKPEYRRIIERAMDELARA